jgi:hypothetical protein
MQELMRRLFWNRSVYRVRRSWKVKTGQSTTSFHPATGNPIMTSSTYNHSVAHATDENKTGCSKELHGVALGSKTGINDGRGRAKKGMVLRLLLVINSMLPISMRPVKSRRAYRRRYLGIRHRVFTWRMLWRSHWKNQLKSKFNLK